MREKGVDGYDHNIGRHDAQLLEITFHLRMVFMEGQIGHDLAFFFMTARALLFCERNAKIALWKFPAARFRSHNCMGSRMAASALS